MHLDACFLIVGDKLWALRSVVTRLPSEVGGLSRQQPDNFGGSVCAHGFEQAAMLGKLRPRCAQHGQKRFLAQTLMVQFDDERPEQEAVDGL